MRYFRIVDDCGFTFDVKTDSELMTAHKLKMLVAHTRQATEITESEFYEDEKRQKGSEPDASVS